MNINQKLATLFLLSALALSTTVNAHESGLKAIVANVVDSAMDSASIEIDQQVQKVTLSASNLISFTASGTSQGKVTITDLASVNTAQSEMTKKDRMSEKNVQKISSDD
jgi:hypothetical protein